MVTFHVVLVEPVPAFGEMHFVAVNVAEVIDPGLSSTPAVSTTNVSPSHRPTE